MWDEFVESDFGVVYCRNWDILLKCLILNNRSKGINEFFLIELLKGDAKVCYWSQIIMALSRPTYSIVILLILLWRKFICDKKICEWNVNKSARRLYIYTPKVE